MDRVSTIDVGGRSERAAADFLRREGFEVLHMNWRSGRYELDIVARRGGSVHFVEVKSRRRGSLTTPESAITTAKAANLFRAATAYIEEYGTELEPRFDLVAVEHSAGALEIRYVADAFAPSW